MLHLSGFITSQFREFAIFLMKNWIGGGFEACLDLSFPELRERCFNVFTPHDNQNFTKKFLFFVWVVLFSSWDDTDFSRILEME